MGIQTLATSWERFTIPGTIKSIMVIKCPKIKAGNKIVPKTAFNSKGRKSFSQKKNTKNKNIRKFRDMAIVIKAIKKVTPKRILE